MESPSSHHILVAEDDKFYREAFVILLQEHGYNVDAADDGKMGLDMMKANTYDLIISDIMHPNLDGLQMVERFNTVASEQGPIWYLSNLADHKDVIKQAYELGVKKILSKSVVSPEEVLVMVDEYFQKEGNSEEEKRKALEKELLGGEADSLPYMLQFDHLKALPDKKYLFIITDEAQRGRFVSAYLDHRVDITNSIDEGIEMMNPEKYKLVYADQKLPENANYFFWNERDGISIYESNEYKNLRESSTPSGPTPEQPASNQSTQEGTLHMFLRFLGFKK
jgi:DNA-binding response OmpR family regulator